MKTEIIEKLETLLAQEDILNINEEFKTLSDDFYKIIKEEERLFEIEKLNRIEAGEKPEAIEKPLDELIDKFKSIQHDFKSKRKALVEQKKLSEEGNHSVKKQLIKEVKTLIQEEEHIGKAIQAIQAIQEKWRNVGPIPRNVRQDIQKEYSNLMDEFQYNINIYKEIKEHDLTKNAVLKEAVIAKLKALVSEKNIKSVEQKLHLLQDEWNDIGGTSAEAWESLKTNYWDTVNAIYTRIKEFYDGKRIEQKENILKKLALIDKIDELLALPCESSKDWKSVTDKIITVQNDWKKVGFGPKKENEIVWKGFRAKCDQFFDAKNEFFKDINADFDKIKDQKLALIEKVNAIKNSEDWNETTKFIVNIQKDWKKLGSAGQRNENKLWKKFRTPIDAFFTKKDAHFDSLDKANAGNLDLKEDLIKKIEEFKVDTDPAAAIKNLQILSKEFNAIGNVPFKEKDRIYAAYKKALNEKYESIEMDEVEKEKIMYSAKIDAIFNSPNMDRELDKEVYFLRSKIDEKIKEKSQVETNLSFFANADESNPLLKSVMQRVENIDKEINNFKLKLNLLNNYDQESE
ncbi:hypothetical protein DNU06_03590 [Putridiphycobacter roseus]|uniref:DUF349 domain-containing protein n=1 Tax=Putridiphycobacter roseus TaxID=2219161 RepID=A0A2W1NIP9_9FLAO|nr:DUF349 domain-containing protein [Putridiphycobacter roseus]PZE18923.1 hypothetical protein DNU06_03590 [Putridiphycobacter roseus]